MKPWTRKEEQILRELKAQGLTHAVIGKRLGRGETAVKSRSCVLGLGKYHRWSAEQEAILRANWSTKTAAQLAELVGRPVCSIHGKAHQLGLPRKWVNHPADIKDQVKKLHARGLTDTEIGNVLTIGRRSINTIRRELGLPVHAERLLESQRRAVKSQWASLGIKNRAGLRYLKHRQYARDHGLPEDLRFRCVQICYALARNGPMTRKQLCEYLGLLWRSIRQNGLKSKDSSGSYLAELGHRGMVVWINRALSTGRQGGNVSLYDLTPEWRERITAHVQQKQLTPGSDGLPSRRDHSHDTATQGSRV